MKKGLVIEGGGLRGAHTAGVLWALRDQGQSDFDVVCATSVGAYNGAYFVTGQHDVFEKIWQQYIHSGRFIRFQNFLRGGPIMDLDYLLNEVYRQKEPLDLKALRETPVRFYVTATDCETGQAHYFNNHEDRMLPALKATGAIPLIYRFAVIIEGRRYMDGGIVDPIPIQKALDEGCEEIWILLTRPPGYRKEPPLLPLLPKIFGKRYPALATAMARQHLVYNQALGRIERGELPCKIRIIRPSKPLPVTRLRANKHRLLDAIQRGYRDALLALQN